MAKNALKYTFIAAISVTALSAFVGPLVKSWPTDSSTIEDNAQPGPDPLSSLHSAPAAEKSTQIPLFPQPADSTVKPPVKPKAPADTSTVLKFNFQDKSVMDPLNYPNGGGLRLNDPTNIKKTVTYDPVTNEYEITQKIGTEDYRPPTYMTPEEYMDYQLQLKIKSYWGQKTKADEVKQGRRSIIPQLHINNEYFDRIFGGNTVDIRPQGTAELIFGLNNSATQNPVLPVNQRSITTFNFNEKIQLNVVGKIGDKLKLTTNYNTEATFDFENQMKIDYTGYEDEIIKKLEAGNVSLPLTGTLITGATSLFGIKATTQFGKCTFTTVLSQDKGKKTTINVTGGAQTSNFAITGDSYEANRHFFLAQYFRDRFDTAMGYLPVIVSDVNIVRLEVWVTNRSNTVTNLRNIVGFADLGENKKHMSPLFASNTIQEMSPRNYLPYNGQNNEYQLVANPKTGFLKTRNFNTISTNLPSSFVISRDYENVSLARMLAPTEFTFNTQLGYLSLNQALNYDEVLAVAFQYTINGKTGTFQVGEFSTDGIPSPEPLVLKLLKATVVNPVLPIWKLMMKNIYSIGGYQVNPQNFSLNIWYNNIATGVNIGYFPDGPQGLANKPLIQVFGLDRLNSNGDAIPDGVFDFMPGITIIPANGRVIFPCVEPFGRYLEAKLLIKGPPPDSTYSKKYGFPELYDSTKTVAQQFPQLNRFTLKGSFQSSSSSDISLNTVNIPQGSVTVTAGGIKLTENVDYTVDYTLGHVKIINQGILNSGTPIQINLESNALFALQTKTLIGTHLDYKANKDFTLGATVMNLNERPLTQKVNIGDEPIDNTVLGVNADYKTQVPFITQMVNKLPFIHTKQPSNVIASGEAAALIPGTNKAINNNSYIDDFEGSISSIDMRAPQAWSFASLPQGQPGFPEAAYTDSLASGYNRALLNWYVLDPLFLRQTNGLTPPYFTNTTMSNNQTREVLETEIFPNEQLASGLPTNTAMFDLAYYPNQRGPYNYDVSGLPGVSQGIDVNGNLISPTTRWAGIQRAIQTNDFEATNIEYLHFWMMDPFNSDNPTPSTQGELYVDIGDVSEDVLKDSRKEFENGLPIDAVNSTAITYDQNNLARVSDIQSLVNAFDIDPNARPFQDVGYDGYRDADEHTYFNSYLQKVAAKWGTSSGAYVNANADPSGDDYHYYRGSKYDNNQVSILDRYKLYNNPDGNSPVAGEANSLGETESYTTSATTLPNTEDINRDNTLNTSEAYFQYKVSLRPKDFGVVGNNYITDILSTVGQNIKDGTTKPIKWYEFKIPIHQYDAQIGAISDFRSVQFMRLFMKGLDKNIVCRFARMEFVRSSWIVYPFSLLDNGAYLASSSGGASFSVSEVSIVENGVRSPVNYVLPPGIQRTVNVQSSNLAQQNEQSLSMTFCGLQDGEAKACYRVMNLDIRMYKTMKMFIHAEAGPNGAALRNGDVRGFIRLGSDFTDNYYEYEIPLQVTAPGNYNGGDENQEYIVWPLSNELDLTFAKLQTAKENRNIAVSRGSGAKTTVRYQANDGANMIYIMGNPNLASVTTIMIGVRNPKQQPGSTKDDGLSKCGQVWVDELRLADFDQHGGWASIGRVKTDLADLGSVSMAGNYSTPGYGSIEQTLNQRQQSTNYGFDVSSNIELGKFTPAKLGIKIPMYVGLSEGYIVPRFDPLDPDVDLKSVLADNSLPKSQRDSLANAVVDYTRRRSLNFTNVKKERGKNKKTMHFYDIENLSLTYTYSEIFHRDVNTVFNETKTYHGGLTYAFTPKPRPVKPFEKTKLNPKYFAMINDLNFNYQPTTIGFATTVDRFFNESQIRDNTGGTIDPLYNKTFNMDRLYNLKWDLTKGLKLDFTADNQARVFEPYGSMDTTYKRSEILHNIEDLGTTTHYHHATNINYTIPINKLPMLDFITSTVRYSTSYDWMHAPFAADSMGATIQNTASWQANGVFNMPTLYNKIPYFKKLALKPLALTKDQKEKEVEDKKKAELVYQKALKIWQNDTSKIKKPKPKDPNKVNQYEILDYLGRLVISVKNITVNYTQNQGTVLPGYNETTQTLGMDPHFFLNPWTSAPGPGFIFGRQDTGFAREAANKGWLVKTPSLNLPYTNTLQQNFTAKTSIELIPDLKIELTANRNYSHNYSEIFAWTIDSLGHGAYRGLTQTETGNFSMSFLSVRTFLEADNASHTSILWDQFLANRATISNFRADAYQKSLGTSLRYIPTITTTGTTVYYRAGYGPASQDVVIPAFLAAYSHHAPRPSDLNMFPAIPMPNWRLNYDGLAKLPSLKKYFKSITISNAYHSTYNITSFTNNLDYVSDGKDDGLTTARDINENFIPKYTIGSVTIAEQFSPLLKVETVWNNSILTSLAVTEERNYSLSMADITLQQMNSQGIVIGAGYKIKGLKLTIAKNKFKSDLVLKVDLSFTNNITIMRQADPNISQATSGQNIITIKTSADYVLNTNLTLRIFFDRIINNPVISSSYPTSNTNAGFSLRFTLSP